jgi:hypothetical protein
MAIYHLTAKVIKRSHGRSAVAAAAYRSASEFTDERQGQAFDYSDQSRRHLFPVSTSETERHD